ncbi:hypothetical protein CHL78_013405 [Romboutsia weinsteinii]|uniref:Uncharacterized protein n=1 Tax=Romboutsia weinsteinii TaxID=2020949 RepID=A0A371J102_9FIRM|nr:hypothetical protein [Romboutsia weinsteinii]RDY26481.1 hypothetical protein CHL78_013405 [Romboutsia weinsteinii]
MGLSIKNYSLLCKQGTAKYNEDIVGITPFGAWVLDGATGLNNKNNISRESDAKWYVQWWNKYLYNNISRNESLRKIILDGIVAIKKEYYSKTEGISVEKIDTPSSSIAIIKYYEDKIEYFILGDCTLYLKDKKTNIIKDDSVSKLDDIVYKKMNSLDNLKELSFEEIKSSVMDVIINNRLKKNSYGGYWILEFDQEAVNNSLHGYLSVESDIQIMMASDGFSCACDKYKIFREDELIDIAEKSGIEHIYNSIKKIELEDFNTIKFPRFKVSDDSSCIYLDIYKIE